MNTRTKGTLGKLALYAAAIIWGTSFFLVKNQMDVFAPERLLALRFSIAAALLTLIFFKKIRTATRSDMWRSAVLGVLLAVAGLMQTIGITDTTPGKNAFLTAIYCVIVPFLFWAVKRTRPATKSFFAAILGFIGIGLISLTKDLTVGFGDALTLLSGVLYAVHIVGIATLGKDVDPVRSIVFQLATCALIFWTVDFMTPAQPVNASPGDWAVVLYLAALPTAAGFLLQLIGQKNAPPAGASLILSLESVFGVLFSVIFYGEIVPPRVFLGFAVVFLAIFLSEADWKWLRRPAAVPESLGDG